MKTLQKMKKSVLFVFVAVLVLLTYGFISESSTNDLKPEKEMMQTYTARSHAGDIAYKCGEGKTKKSTQKKTDKCGEAKCGEGKSEKKASRKKASKCGEGKCGKS